MKEELPVIQGDLRFSALVPLIQLSHGQGLLLKAGIRGGFRWSEGILPPQDVPRPQRQHVTPRSQPSCAVTALSLSIYLQMAP